MEEQQFIRPGGDDKPNRRSQTNLSEHFLDYIGFPSTT